MGGTIDEKTKVPLGWVIGIFVVIVGATITACLSYGALNQKVDNQTQQISDLKQQATDTNARVTNVELMVSQLLNKDKVAQR